MRFPPSEVDDDVKEMAMDNRERLKAEGLIAETELPPEYYEVIDSLEPGEVEMLISLNQRLIDAGIPTTPLTGKQSIVPL